MQTEIATSTVGSEQIQIILDKTPCLIFMVDPDTLNVTFVNTGLTEILGYTQAEMLSMRAVELNPVYTDAYWQHVLAMLCCDLNAQANIELSLLTKNDVVVPVEAVLRTIEIFGYLRVFAVAQDITDRLSKDNRLIRVTKFYKALSEVNQAIVRIHQESELLPLVCKMAVDFGGIAMAWVGKLNELNGLIEPLVSCGQGAEYLDHIVISADASLASGLGPVGTAYREQRTVIINDFMADRRTRPWHKRAAQMGWQAVAAFPIRRGGKVFAVLGLYHPHRDAFDNEIIQLVEELCGDIAFALDNFDREKQRAAQQAELKLAALVFQHSSQAMMVTDERNVVIFVNQAYTNTSGFSLDEVRGKPPKVANSGRHGKGFYKAIWDALSVHHYWQGQIWSLRKNGEIYPEWLTVNVVLDMNGVPYRYVATLSDITDKIRSEETIWRQANFDMLTGLSNRYTMYRQLAEEINRGQQDATSLCVLYIDLDQFKEVNDTLGHQVGDLLLVEVAARINACAGQSATTARLGGDEFAVILFDRSRSDNVTQIAECIINRLHEPFKVADEQRDIYISASLGAAFFPADAKDAEDLLKKAEQAMYAAKNMGRNRFYFYTSGLQEKAQKRLTMQRDLREALANQQFVLDFQPIVDMFSGEIVKAEALLRWHHPLRGIVNPDEFIPLAEETGLIIAIGDWVFKQAADRAKQWVEAGANDFQVSVNMSPVQFRDEATKIATWLDYLQQIGLSGKHLIIEITEGLLLDVTPVISDKLLAFRDAGIQVSIDDFGTGYSALSYLKKFHIDYLKIDQSFVHDMTYDASDAALSEAIVVMAHKLGLKVVAEGVETEQQHKLLQQFGCDYGQGFWYAQPLAAQAFGKLLVEIKL